MKRSVVFLLPVLFLSSCYVDQVEPRYDSRDRLIGYYEVEEYSETYDDFTYYDIRVSKSSYRDEVYLNNFYGVDICVFAVINGDRITIPLQEHDGYRIEGVGNFYGGELRLNYSVKDLYANTRTDFCETVAWLE